jgi:hypothetical protein
MPCLLIIVALILPRVTLFFIWLATDWFGKAYETAIWPLLGFFIMPYTTLAYMAAMLNNNHQVSGWWLALIIVAALIDLGGNGETARRRSRR